MRGARRWGIAVGIAAVLALLPECGTRREVPNVTARWSAAPVTWSLGGGPQAIEVSVTNRGMVPAWVTIKPFENACFACAGYGPWTDGWNTAGPIGGDDTREIAVPFTPKAACPSAEYYFYVAVQKTPDAKATEFSTPDRFRVAITE